MSRRLFLPILSVLISSIFSLSNASAGAPAAPSGLKVTPLGVNTFQVEWTDNSTNETGFELRVGLKSKSRPPRFLMIPTLNTTGKSKQSKLIITNPLPNKELNFQISAYNGLTNFEVFSTPSAILTVRALTPTKFLTPTNLVAKVIDDGQIKLSWTDNCTSEYGYQIEIKKGDAAWSLFNVLGPGTKFSFPTFGYDAKTKYSFRVRAFKENPLKFTAYSNIQTVATKEFQAPTGLVVKTSGEGGFIFKWKDNSSLETGVSIEAKSGSGNFASFLKAAGSDFTDTNTITGFSLDTDYQFRLRVYRVVNNKEVYSAYSNVVPIKSAPMTAPTDLAAAVSNNTSAVLTWKNTSTSVNGYEIQYREVGATDFNTSSSYSTALTQTIPDLLPNKSYEFRIRGFSFFSSAKSAYTVLVPLNTKNGITSNLNPPIVAGGSFLYPISVSRPAELTGLTVTGLPAGLTYNSSLQTITGTLTTGGTYTVTITATFSDGTTTVRSLILKSVGQAPVVSQSFAAVSLAVAETKSVPVAGKFSDPDTASAARLTTTLGTFDIILFPDATPKTVANFLDYVDDLRYNNSFFHRAPNNFVVQGGGYLHTDAGGYSRIYTFPPVVNEPGLSNVRGTVAMAKLGGQPDSATSQFFINVADNSANLDAQNGGFTVFGRVPTSGMTVLDSINHLPKGTYDITTGLGLESLTDLPVNAEAAPETLDPAELVKITAVDAAPILSYQAVSQDGAVATATVTGTDVVITGIATGTTTIVVTATDLDGNTVSQNIAVTVP